MSLIYARLQDLSWPERLIRMRHYLKVPIYALRRLQAYPFDGIRKNINAAVNDAEVQMNLLEDWADIYPKG